MAIAGRFLVFLIDAYRRWVSPMLPDSCRFAPSCSQYSRTAIIRYGALRGGWLSLVRIFKCHPYHPGGYDPVK